MVYFIPDTAVDPIEPVAYKIRFSFSNPDLLLKSAIEKYGEPSVSDAQRGRYIWCKALAEKTNKCDDSKSELTLTTREVEDTGILTLSDPTVSFDACGLQRPPRIKTRLRLKITRAIATALKSSVAVQHPFAGLLNRLNSSAGFYLNFTLASESTLSKQAYLFDVKTRISQHPGHDN